MKKVSQTLSWSTVPVIVSSLLLTGCSNTSLPPGVEPVGDFDLNGYLGKWYEIARLDNRFERGLEQITAEYSLREDGGVKVVNRGYKTAKGEWSEIEGKAYPVRGADEGFLKVSFFGPFYGSYCVFEWDRKGEREYAFVSGANHSYLWLLARQPTVSDALLDRFRTRAAELGFDTDGLVYVKH